MPGSRPGMTRRSGCLIAHARVARKNPFIGRLTRAYLNFEVKDGAPISAFAGIGI
jgi:hypothetical protein